jgi:hypothetical protein
MSHIVVLPSRSIVVLPSVSRSILVFFFHLPQGDKTGYNRYHVGVVAAMTLPAEYVELPAWCVAKGFHVVAVKEKHQNCAEFNVVILRSGMTFPAAHLVGGATCRTILASARFVDTDKSAHELALMSTTYETKGEIACINGTDGPSGFEVVHLPVLLSLGAECTTNSGVRIGIERGRVSPHALDTVGSFDPTTCSCCPLHNAAPRKDGDDKSAPTKPAGKTGRK